MDTSTIEKSNIYKLYFDSSFNICIYDYFSALT